MRTRKKIEENNGGGGVDRKIDPDVELVIYKLPYSAG